MLDRVKKSLGITGDYQNDTLTEYIEEVKSYLMDAGVDEGDITPGIVARGVADLWNYGSGEAKFSSYFMQRAAQLAYRTTPDNIEGAAEITKETIDEALDDWDWKEDD